MSGSDWNLTNSTQLANSSTTVCSNEYCVSDADYLDMIRDYVFPTVFEWTLTALYILVFVLGVTGNGLVCYVVWHNSHMRTVTNVFIVNLSAGDLLVLVVCLPPTALVDITETWYFGVAMCKLVHYLQVRIRLGLGLQFVHSIMLLAFWQTASLLPPSHPTGEQAYSTST